MKLWIPLGVCLVLLTVSRPLEAQISEARSTMQKFIDAQNAGDLEMALELWADDGVIINTRGRSVVGKENLRGFIEGNIRRSVHQAPESIRATGSKVMWTNHESNDSYRMLGIAPV